MSYYMKKRIGERLNYSSESIEVAQTDPEISERMALYNFGPDQLAEGRRRTTLAASRELTQRIQLGKQSAATNYLNEMERKVRSLFNADRSLTRVLLSSESPLYFELRLNLNTEAKREVFLQQARHFYQEAIAQEDIATLLLSEFSMSKETLENRLTKLDDLEEAMRIQQVRIGEAQVATQKRREAMKELDTWMSSFIGVARQAFKEEPKQLKKLGLRVKSRT